MQRLCLWNRQGMLVLSHTAENRHKHSYFCTRAKLVKGSSSCTGCSPSGFFPHLHQVAIFMDQHEPDCAELGGAAQQKVCRSRLKVQGNYGVILGKLEPNHVWVQHSWRSFFHGFTHRNRQIWSHIKVWWMSSSFHPTYTKNQNTDFECKRLFEWIIENINLTFVWWNVNQTFDARRDAAATLHWFNAATADMRQELTNKSGKSQYSFLWLKMQHLAILVLFLVFK